MTSKQIEEIIEKKGQSLCMRIAHHDDGSMLVADASRGGNRNDTFRGMLAASLVVIAMAAPALGQQDSHSTLEGVVTDVTGAPIAGGVVKLVSNQVSVADSKTDGKGHFRVVAPTEGAYQLTISSVGFVDRSEAVTLHAGRQALPGNLTMSVSGLMGEVVVVAEKPKRKHAK